MAAFTYSAPSPHCSDGKIADLRTGRWFNPRLGHYSFRGLMLVIPLSPLSVVLTIVMWKAASGLEEILCRVLG